MRRRRAALAVRKLMPVAEPSDGGTLGWVPRGGDASRRSPPPPGGYAEATGCAPARGPARILIRAGGTHHACPAVDRSGPGDAGPTGFAIGRSAGCLTCRRCSGCRRRRCARTPARWIDSTPGSKQLKGTGRSVPSWSSDAWCRSSSWRPSSRATDAATRRLRSPRNQAADLRRSGSSTWDPEREHVQRCPRRKRLRLLARRVDGDVLRTR